MDLGKQALHVGGRVLGMGTAAMRMPIAESINSFLPTGMDITRPEDFKRGLEGNPPSVDEYLERGGVGKGFEASGVWNSLPALLKPALIKNLKFAEKGQGGFLQPEKGGSLDFSARGAAGAAGDVATDPLTYTFPDYFSW